MREQRGLSVSGLAAAVGVAESRLLALEEGRLDADFELLSAIADSIGVSFSEVVIRAEALRDASAEGR